MSPLALAALLLVQEDLAATADAFSRGDAEAGAALRKAGVRAILPLRRVRERDPKRVGDLLFEIRKDAGGEGAAAAVRALEEHADLLVGAGSVETILGAAVPLAMLDPCLPAEIRSAVVKVEGRGRAALESLCGQAGLDYGFFYGRIVVATPERLWPSEPPPRRRPLTEEETAAARRWIDRFGSEKVEERDDAHANLKKLGEAAVPLLEAKAEGGEAEVAGRCRDLVALARRPPPAGVFRKPAFERQKLGEEDAELLKMLAGSEITIKVKDLSGLNYFRLLMGSKSLDFSMPDCERRVNVSLEGVPFTTAIALAAHACGFDAMIRDGKLAIDVPEEIERRIAPK